ncbi:MAG: phosphate transport system permease protein [Pseudonocardiales bacterium]|nr:phosphate transport system permease protein [Pseudonocardiales bacterium]
MTDQESRDRERARAMAERAATHASDTPDDYRGNADPNGVGVIPSSSALATPALADAPVSGSGVGAFGARGKVRIGDKVFRYLTAGAGMFVCILITLVAVFLLAKAIPSIANDKVNFFTSRAWQVSGSTLEFGIVDLLWTTVLSSVFAMLLAVPVAIGIALFITQYAPRQLARPVAFVVDLLAAIPSIVYGVFGITVFAPKLHGIIDFLNRYLGWIPLFKKQISDPGTVFAGGIILAIMILPIITAIAREVYERTPRENVEAAWALGATKWEMVRLSVLPYGKPGVISGAMLGLGRALGETIAITLILVAPPSGAPFSPSLFYGGETFASKIANAAAEFNNPTQTGAYIAAGLVLFVLTFAVNAAARMVVNRRREFS